MTAYGPADFLRMIRESSLVITDSFHAVSFSILFETPFFVLDRADEESVNSRITDLLDDMDLMPQMVCSAQPEDAFMDAPDFARARNMIRCSKEASERFLEEALRPLRKP